MAEPRSALCPDCDALLAAHEGEVCRYCGVASPRPSTTSSSRCSECDFLPGSFEEARSAFPYASPAGNIVRNMKYQAAPYNAEWLVALSMPYLHEWLLGIKPATIVPVPMATSRARKRGFNQAEEIGRALSIAMNWPIEPKALRRAKFAGPQARFRSRELRIENLENAFTTGDPLAIGGKRILLVDDVMTTGATVSAAADELKKNGSGDVFVFTPVRARLAIDDDSDLAQ